MSDARRFQLDELTIRPGTYFNPQTEVLVVVDDSPEVDHEIFESEEFDAHRLGADRRRGARRRTPPRRADRAASSVTYAPGGELLSRRRRRDRRGRGRRLEPDDDLESSSANSRAGATRATARVFCASMPSPPPGRAATPAARPARARAARTMRRVRAKLLWTLALGVLRSLAATASPAAAPRGPSRVRRAAGASSAAARSRRPQYTQYYNDYVAAKSSLGRLSGTRRSRARRGDEQRAGDGRERRASSLAAAGDVPHARTQPPLVDHRTAALQRHARELPGQQDRLAVLRRARASRSSGSARSARATATTSRATKTPTCASCVGEVAAAGDQARRRHRLGVHVPVRRRPPAVDERAVAGHGAAGARALVAALQRTGAA